MTRLHPDLLAGYRGAADLPGYDRRTVRAGILHMGVGAFHRAHQAHYVDLLLDRAPDWGIVGASLRRGDMRAALAPQEGLYVLAVRGGEGLSARVIGALLDVLDGGADPAPVLAAMADPGISLVTLTVTEKGYCSPAGD
jgi:Mannitol-1-phosphate/altronate dehydrogenases